MPYFAFELISKAVILFILNGGTQPLHNEGSSFVPTKGSLKLPLGLSLTRPGCLKVIWQKFFAKKVPTKSVGQILK